MEGVKYPEYRMALTINRQPCTFGAKDYWVRGIADLMVVDGDQGYIVDYKTGSNKYPDPKQLQLMALMGFAFFPEVTHFKAGLLFVAHNDFVTSEYQREKIDKYWDDFAPQLKRLQLSYENGVWQENPTPLCGWCPVSDCTHYKGK
jgi:RecB family exonuclease